MFWLCSKNMLDLRWGCSCDVSDVQSLNITVFYCRTCGWYCFLSDYGSLNCRLPAWGLTFYEHISLNVEQEIFQIYLISFYKKIKPSYLRRLKFLAKWVKIERAGSWKGVIWVSSASIFQVVWPCHVCCVVLYLCIGVFVYSEWK